MKILCGRCGRAIYIPVWPWGPDYHLWVAWAIVAAGFLVGLAIILVG